MLKTVVKKLWRWNTPAYCTLESTPCHPFGLSTRPRCKQHLDKSMLHLFNIISRPRTQQITGLLKTCRGYWLTTFMNQYQQKGEQILNVQKFCFCQRLVKRNDTLQAASWSPTVERKWRQGHIRQCIHSVFVRILGKSIAASSKLISPIAIPGMSFGDCMKQTVFQPKFLGQVHHANLPAQEHNTVNSKQRGGAHPDAKCKKTNYSNLTEIDVHSLSQKSIISNPDRSFEPPSLPLSVSRWP